MKNLSTILLSMIMFGCISSVKQNEKLVKAINDSTISIRGNLIEIAENDYRYDYYDVSEIDSHLDYLDREGFQGGGYSWAGIVYGAIKLSDPNLLNSIRLDPEADGLAIWSSDKSSLEKIGRLIAVIKTDNEVLSECINVANKYLVME